jgi:hypothetical protein
MALRMAVAGAGADKPPLVTAYRLRFKSKQARWFAVTSARISVMNCSSTAGASGAAAWRVEASERAAASSSRGNHREI